MRSRDTSVFHFSLTDHPSPGVAGYIEGKMDVSLFFGSRCGQVLKGPLQVGRQGRSEFPVFAGRRQAGRLPQRCGAMHEVSRGTQNRPPVGGSNAATGRELQGTSSGLSRQGFVSLLRAQFPSVVHSVAPSL